MPMFFPGKSRCPLCKQPMTSGQHTRGFPPFLRPEHSLSVLSDAVVHQDCFDTWEHKEVFARLLDMWENMMLSRPTHLDWKRGEAWIKAEGDKFQEAAALLDPAVKRTDG